MNGVPVELIIEATDGDTYETYPVLFDMFIRDAQADVHMFAFNVKSRSSFEHISRDYGRIKRLTANSRCPIGVVGIREDNNKTLLLEERTVPEEEGKMLAKTLSSTTTRSLQETHVSYQRLSWPL